MKNIIFILIVISFFKLFLIYDPYNWGTNFTNMGVPVHSLPGGDSRNIQLASFCSKKGYDVYTENICNREEVLTEIKYTVPPYNYPSIWVKIYSLFDSTEISFMIFWYINALCVIFTIVSLSLIYNKDYLFLVLFNPVTLLTIERGNIDGIVFSLVVFSSLILSRFPFISSFLLTMSSALKLYPVVLLPILFMQRVRGRIRVLLFLGFLFGLFFLIKTIYEIKYILNGTPIGFNLSYGFLTLKSSPLLRDADFFLKHLTIVFFIFFILLIIYFFIKKKIFYRDVSFFVKNISDRDFNLLFSCLSIYCFTFLFFGNWAYRYIFLVPIFMIVSKHKSIIFILLKVNILLIFWIKFFSFYLGGILINLLGYPMFILSFYLFFYLIKDRVVDNFLLKIRSLKLE